ncbi:MAG TPA: hypothetical protein PLZ93_25935 [Nocardioides sp.]|uniref:hypothetical protein n=1 Tax=uncultured Nocardioides sp. TaxID=198441 RepID=UPI002603432B|nr:hypothetical protein [uncultured Nocardioides sp.]HRD60683.1 hypothetical protein [Nocardioides sp.]HRI99091.1 hypothetical protein [Nocardioides sp.]HRK47162.1 hypothetical protein [Nocardioides sp.]
MAESDRPAAEPQRHKMPPFRPDPELLGVIEGNTRQLAKAKRDLYAYLRELDEQERRLSEG